MNIFIVLSLPLSMMVSVLGSTRCFCPDEYQPVCGVDGITYDNPCRLSCEEVRLYYVGECGHRKISAVSQSLDHCSCPVNYDPVCGEDRSTYNNECFAGCAKVQINHRGECKMNKVVCKCPTEYDPVCGYDGVTYENVCTLACQGAQLHHMGACGPKPITKGNVISKCVCPPIYDPLCGKDGNTYTNACFMKCMGVQLDYKGDCATTRFEQYCKCPAIYRPVCGIDRVTYNNACFLLCTGVLLNYTGECYPTTAKLPRDNIDTIKEVCTCPTSLEAVCGLDGNTYRNKCLAACAGLKLAHTGRCKMPKCDNHCHCPALHQPVCGYNRVTYLNKCCLMCDNTAVYFHAGPC